MSTLLALSGKAMGFAIFLAWEVMWWRLKAHKRTITYWILSFVVVLMVIAAIFMERRRKK